MAWSGFGWLGYVVIVGVTFGIAWVLDWVFGPGFALQNPLILAVCSWPCASLLCWPVGRLFNRTLPLQVFDTDWAWRGRTAAHSTFFVRLEFAGLVVGFPLFLILALSGFGRRAGP
jgi:hypothetical protein